jgi:hypothetical protein
MTAQGLGGAFRFMRTFLIAILTVVAAGVHPLFIVVGVLAFVLMAWNEVSRHRRDGTEESDRENPKKSAWWAGVLMPMGLGVWATFLYLGAGTRRRSWLVWSAIYLSAIVLGGYLNMLGNDEDPTLSAIASLLWLGTWAAGGLHAYLIRDQILIELSQAKGYEASTGRPTAPRQSAEGTSSL